MKDKRNTNISFIFPVHNEEKFLDKQIKSFLLHISILKSQSFEVLLVENGSTDRSWKKASSLQERFSSVRALRIEGSSYGRAVRHGILSSLGGTIFILNVDFYGDSFISESLQIVSKNLISVGSKSHRESQDSRGFLRQLLTKTHCTILKYVFGYSGSDTHGIKALKNTDLIKKAIQICRAKHEFFDTELLVRLSKCGVQIIELPVTVQEIRKSRYTSLKRIRHSLIDLYRVSLSIFLNKLGSFDEHTVIADDYGISPIVNQAIIDQCESGSVNKVSILANLCSQDSFKELRKIEGQEFGLHINLLRGTPISEVSKVPSLVRNDLFYSLPWFLVRLLLKKVTTSELKLEIENQLEYLKNRKIKVSYLDSEQHMHLFEPVKSVIATVAKKHGLMVRSELSTKVYLRYAPIKFVVFVLTSKILNLIYNERAPEGEVRYFDGRITHPATNYD